MPTGYRDYSRFRCTQARYSSGTIATKRSQLYTLPNVQQHYKDKSNPVSFSPNQNIPVTYYPNPDHVPRPRMTPDEYYRGIEAVCGLVIELWDIIIISAQCYDVTSIRLLPSSESTPYKNPDRYELRLAPLKNGVLAFPLTGAAIGLPNAEPHIQRAVLMYNHCVTSWVVLRNILKKLLYIGKNHNSTVSYPRADYTPSGF